MAKSNDPAMYESGYARLQGDRYWTEPRLTRVLLRHWGDRLLDLWGGVWEPAAGRGDMATVLREHGLDVVMSDADVSELPPGTLESDFLSPEAEGAAAVLGVDAVVTNPPYKVAKQFVRRALDEDVRIVAMLLRSAFADANTDERIALFDEEPFAAEIKIKGRPYWDWWFRAPPAPGEKRSTPRHDYSWFVWDRDWAGRPTIIWDRGGPEDQ